MNEINPVADYTKIVEHCSGKIKSYFEKKEPMAFKALGVKFNSLTRFLDSLGILKFTKTPRPSIVQNATTQTIQIFYSNDHGKILTPIYRIKYQHTPLGLKLNHEYDTEIITIEGLKNETQIFSKIQTFDEKGNPTSI